MSVENTLSNTERTSGSKRIPSRTECDSTSSKIPVQKGGEGSVSCQSESREPTIKNKGAGGCVRKDAKVHSSAAKSHWKDSVSERTEGLSGFRMNLAIAENTVRYYMGGNSLYKNLPSESVKDLAKSFSVFVDKYRETIDRGGVFLVQPPNTSKWYFTSLFLNLIGIYTTGTKLLDTDDILSAYRTDSVHSLVSRYGVVILHLGSGDVDPNSKKGDLLLSTIGEILSCRKGKLTFITNDCNYRLNVKLIERALEIYPNIVKKELV